MTDTYGYVLDIETAPIDGVDDYLGDVSAPANYKNKEAIDKYKAEAKGKAREGAALDIDLCRIVAVAIQLADKPLAPFGWVARNGEEEHVLLKRLAGLLIDPQFGPLTIIGHNVLQFDVPVLMRRAMYLGVTFPRYDVSKYRHEHIVDTQQILSFNGMLKYRSKDFYCKRFGIHEDDKLTGADVPAAIARGDYDAVLAHCIADVRKEYRLALAIDAISA